MSDQASGRTAAELNELVERPKSPTAVRPHGVLYLLFCRTSITSIDAIFLDLDKHVATFRGAVQYGTAIMATTNNAEDPQQAPDKGGLRNGAHAVPAPTAL